MFIPVLLGVLFIVFAINHLSPGDPVVQQLGSNYTQEQYNAKQAEMGLDKPFFAQFYTYTKGIVTKLDFGNSYQTHRPVGKEIMERLPVTLKLSVMGIIITILLGIPFGIISATKQYSKLDYSVTVGSLVFASIPGFWLALMMIIVFSLNLKLVPASGIASWKSWILPVLAVGLSPVASITRMTRSSMLDVVRQDYIRTARSKGLSEGVVIRKHALKNALIPVVTVTGILLGILVGGSVIVEAIFNIPGIGLLMMTAINNKDFPVIQGGVVVLSLFVCIINLLTDLLYGFIDPRIKASYKSGKMRKKPKPAINIEGGAV